MGEKSQIANEFANLLKELLLKEDVKIKLMDSVEAETVKLFSNTYLAIRVAYFNELDTFSEIKGLNSKDTKQLASSYIGILNNLITSIVNSNVTRKSILQK